MELPDSKKVFSPNFDISINCGHVGKMESKSYNKLYEIFTRQDVVDFLYAFDFDELVI